MDHAKKTTSISLKVASALAYLSLAACGGSSSGSNDTSTEPTAPTAVITALLSYDENSTFSLSGNQSHDQDGPITEYQWSVIDDGGTNIYLTNADQADVELTVGEIVNDTAITIQLSVTDQSNLSGETTETITIKEIHFAQLPPHPGQASLSSLAGIDSDNDGIRDDLEHAIYNLYPTNSERREIQNYGAKALQASLLAAVADSAPQAALAKSLVSNWATCLKAIQQRDSLPDHFAPKELAKIRIFQFNTSERLERLDHYLELVDGTVSGTANISLEECHHE